MRCIFCKSGSDGSRSIEHIIPESLGNTEHTLPRRVVCDACNNYFARKIEAPLLASQVFVLLRARQRIPNKRGLIPTAWEWERDLPGYRLMGRFLAKVGIEVLAQRVLSVSGWNDEFVGNSGLDKIRRYVRRNEGKDWPFAFRTLYSVNTVFSDAGVFFDVPHEYTILVTPTSEYYLAIALFGVEFVINLGGQSLDGWAGWLSDNNGSSPLYPAPTER